MESFRGHEITIFLWFSHGLVMPDHLHRALVRLGAQAQPHGQLDHPGGGKSGRPGEKPIGKPLGKWENQRKTIGKWDLPLVKQE